MYISHYSCTLRALPHFQVDPACGIRLVGLRVTCFHPQMVAMPRPKVVNNEENKATGQ